MTPEPSADVIIPGDDQFLNVLLHSSIIRWYITTCTRSAHRITSYNVCYTKLLRKVSLQIVRNGQTSTPNTLELFIRGVDAKGVDNAFMKDPTDSIFGHAAVEEVVTVGSVEPAAPFTISPDSSQGPVTIRYPTVTKRWKPDICAPTNVNVSGAGNFPNPFPVVR